MNNDLPKPGVFQALMLVIRGRVRIRFNLAGYTSGGNWLAGIMDTPRGRIYMGTASNPYLAICIALEIERRQIAADAAA